MNTVYLTLALVIAILLAWLTIRRPGLAMALVAAALPSYLIRFKVGPIPLTLLEVMILAVFIAWFIKGLWQKPPHPKDFQGWLGPWRWPVCLFLVAATLAIIWAPDRTAALGVWKAYFLEPIMFFLVVGEVVWRKPVVSKMIIGALALSALALSAWAILQRFGHFGLVAPWDGIAEPIRAVAIYHYPNALALFLAPLAAFFLALALGRLAHSVKYLSPATRYCAGFVAIMSVVAIYLTGSRGALLGVFAALVWIGLFSTWRRYLIGLLVALLLAAAFVPALGEKVGTVFSGQDVSTDVRLVMWQGTGRLLAARWFTGAGLAGFPQVYDQYRLTQHTELLVYPHNIILNFWSETGLLGLAAFSWLVVLAFKKSWSDITKRGNLVSLGISAALVALIVHGLVDVPYFKNDLATQFWLLLGLLIISSREREALPSKKDR